MKLDVKEMISDVLQTEKAIVSSYCKAELESSNQLLRDKLREQQNKLQVNHAKLFHEMHQRGWYKTPTASQQAIESMIITWEQKFQKEPVLSSRH